jgi:hypothetical protein
LPGTPLYHKVIKENLWWNSNKTIDNMTFRNSLIKVDGFSNDEEFEIFVDRNNFYFCPIGYNYEEEQILDKADVDKINNSTSIPKTIYVRNSSKQHLIYTGFVDTIKDEHNNKICLPCCYKNIKKSRIDECTKDSLSKNLVKGQLYKNISYILQQEKLFISPNRYGFLPPVINELFNTTFTIVFDVT